MITLKPFPKRCILSSAQKNQKTTKAKQIDSKLGRYSQKIMQRNNTDARPLLKCNVKYKIMFTAFCLPYKILNKSRKHDSTITAQHKRPLRYFCCSLCPWSTSLRT